MAELLDERAESEAVTDGGVPEEEAFDDEDELEDDEASAASARCAELLAKAEEIKAAGNELFKAKQYKKAIVKFSKVRAYTWLPTGEAAQYGQGVAASRNYSAAEVSAITRLDFIACGNVAQCYVGLGEYRKALDFCAKVVGPPGGNAAEQDARAPHADLHVKALARSALCALELSDLDVSKALVGRALALDATCAPARAVYKRLQAAYKDHREAQKKQMAAAFASA